MSSFTVAVVISYLLFMQFACCDSLSLESTTTNAANNRAMQQRRLVKSAYELNNVDRITPATYSNRANLTLTPVIDGKVWSCDRPFLWNGIDVSCRATLILKGDTLFVHSPVSLERDLQTKVDGIIEQEGVKRMIVLTTNYEHLKYVPEWYLKYGLGADVNGELEVKFYGCPGIRDKVEEVKWDGEIGGDEELWDYDVLEPLHVGCERVLGKPFFNEVVFYFKEEGVFVSTDLFWNYPKLQGVNPTLTSSGDWGEWELAPPVKVPFSSRLWKFGMDKVYKPVYNKFMVSDQEEFSRVKDKILDEWEIHVAVPAHGDIVRGEEACAEALNKHFGRRS
ncbi:hypothetical protein TrST_g3599 [Triparma strigata]|uniref:Metallo-beta-lactamase domain-containing protein n=1 Tax=Triparma strigata TaxID=1606541 RepID=A0A9W7ENF1_9STRA|nr:hypothetical protein TrST_g3599 [Triparma strigata]